MERLTSERWKNLDPWECCGQDHFCTRGRHDLGGCMGGCIVPKLYVCLGKYEDTGLTPEGIIELCAMSNRAKIADILRLEEYRDIGPIDHLRELVQAEKDGRLMVLPVK